MLNQILSIAGKPGLYKLVSQGKNMLIVESLSDQKRMPTYARDKIVSLADVSMYTTGEDVALSEVLTKLGEKQSLKPVDMDLKNASADMLRMFFEDVLPDFDRDRVYPSDIQKLIKWYNVLIAAGITDFSVERDNDEKGVDAAADEKEKREEQKLARQTQVKTQKKTTGASAKTGVGAKKG